MDRHTADALAGGPAPACLPTAARVTASARRGRQYRRVLATTGALGTDADVAGADVRL